MKLNLFAISIAFGLCFASDAFTAEISIGHNHIVCENELFGTFDLTFTVKNHVVSTEFYKAENAEPVPSWEHLETELQNLEYTSGTIVKPSGTKGVLPGASLEIVRNVFQPTTRPGLIQASLAFPKELGFLLDTLTIDHNHPEKYLTDELGAQTFTFINGQLAQLFFVCR